MIPARLIIFKRLYLTKWKRYMTVLYKMHKEYRMQVKKCQNIKSYVKKLSTFKSAHFREKGTYKRSYTHYPQKKWEKIIRFYGNF